MASKLELRKLKERIGTNFKEMGLDADSVANYFFSTLGLSTLKLKKWMFSSQDIFLVNDDEKKLVDIIEMIILKRDELGLRPDTTLLNLALELKLYDPESKIGELLEISNQLMVVGSMHNALRELRSKKSEYVERKHSEETDYQFISVPEIIELDIELGNVPPSELANLFVEISTLYRMLGGSGIDFSYIGTREYEYEEEFA